MSRSGVGGVREVRGDASDAAVAREAVAGADAVILTVGGSKENPLARTEVTRAVVDAMRKAGVERLVVQTSLGSGDSANQLPWIQRSWQARRHDEPGSDGGTIARADGAACLLSAATGRATVGAQLGISGA